MIVVDACVLADALVDPGPRGEQARRALALDPSWAMPDHCYVEVFATLRKWALSERLPEPEARRALKRLSALTVDVVATVSLLAGMWELRHDISGYDAAYVALAAVRGLTLVTADAPLARAAVRHCRVELVS